MVSVNSDALVEDVLTSKEIEALVAVGLIGSWLTEL